MNIWAVYKFGRTSGYGRSCQESWRLLVIFEFQQCHFKDYIRQTIMAINDYWRQLQTMYWTLFLSIFFMMVLQCKKLSRPANFNIKFNKVTRFQLLMTLTRLKYLSQFYKLYIHFWLVLHRIHMQGKFNKSKLRLIHTYPLYFPLQNYCTQIDLQFTKT